MKSMFEIICLWLGIILFWAVVSAIICFTLGFIWGLVGYDGRIMSAFLSGVIYQSFMNCVYKRSTDDD